MKTWQVCDVIWKDCGAIWRRGIAGEKCRHVQCENLVEAAEKQKVEPHLLMVLLQFIHSLALPQQKVDNTVSYYEVVL